MKAIFKNQLDAIRKNHFEKLNTVKNATKEEILKSWYLNELLTSLMQKKLKKDEISLDVAKDKMIKKLVNKFDKDLKNRIHEQGLIESAKDIKSMDIAVSWSKGGTYGMQAKAEIKISFTDGICERLEGSFTGGCGYDKESTAIAEILNQSYAVKKLLHKYGNKIFTKGLTNEEVFSYGVSVYGTKVPRFEGGVGVSCYYRNFEKLGFKFKDVAHGKMFDVYTITKK